MPNRKYDARLLDFQIAACATSADVIAPTGAPAIWQKSQVAAILGKIIDLAAIPDQFMPMALRWRISPEIGLPISPFKVYKRKKSPDFPMPAVITIPGYGAEQLIGGPYWQLSFTLKNVGSQQSTITVVPLDQNRDPFTDAQQKFTLAPNATTPVKMKFPNIFGIGIISGTGVLQTITGSRMEDVLNDPGWVLAENVGLPFKVQGPAATVYQNLQQGYTSKPVAGYQAAMNRLTIAQLFYKAPKYLQPDGVTLPAWPLPPPTALVDSYHVVQHTAHGNTTGILYDIEEMLTRVRTSPQLYDGRQAAYVKEIGINGFSDDGSQPSQPAKAKNPVCGTTLMGAATDCWSALGLGFGTTDFATPAADASPDCDYMVSATFQLPVYSYPVTDKGVVRKFSNFDLYEIAAIAHMAQPLGPVSGAGSEIHSENRPVKLDAHFSDDVKLYWNGAGSNVPQSYALAVKDAFNNNPVYLNAQRPFLAGIKKPHLPTARADAEADDLPGADAATKNRFFHHRSERSDTAPVTKQYYVAANDVFGRWSAFAKTVSTLPIAPQVTADIISGQFLLDMPADPLLHKYAGMLELIVAWHWDDRAPLEINIGGHFQVVQPPPALLDLSTIVTPTGIALNQIGSVTIDLSIAFNGTTPYVKKLAPQPGIATANEATVSIDTAQSKMPHLGVYKIKIKGFSIDFKSDGKLAFAAYLRSREVVTPAILTPAGKPKMIYVLDPRPRTAPVLPPDIQWGSLPDAQNVSRFRVSFPSVPGVAGYAIYRATEASLREKGALAPVVPADSINTRRDQLMALAGKPALKDAFIRLNTNILPAPSADVELPGDLNGLYIYAITTFTAQRAESDFGNTWLYVGVPRRYTPPAPVLSAFTKKVPGMQNAREVTLNIELPQGVRTDRVEVFRTTKRDLAASLDLMGPAASETPVHQLGSGWKAYDAAGAEIAPVLATSIVASLKKTETFVAGWQPLHYRAAGFGANDKPAGKLPGRSGSSNLAEVLPAPSDNPPTLVDATLMSQGGGLLRLEAFTNGSIHPTPYGSFRMQIEKRDLATNVYNEVLTRELPLIPAKKAGDIPVPGTLWRLGKDGAGNYEYEYYVAAEDVASYRITVTDPLGRSISATVSHEQLAAAFRNLVVKPYLLSTEVSFELSISNKAPEFGHYFLEIILQKKLAGNPVPVSTKVYFGNLDAIGNVIVPAANPAMYVAGKSADGFYLYDAVFKGSAYGNLFNGATVLLRLTDPDGKVTTYTNTGRQAG